LSFLKTFQGIRVAIDEVQRVPDLLLSIKKAVDEDRTPGRFLLTGSANILSYPKVSESLAGRMDIVSLEGLSLSELKNNKFRPSFLEEIFSEENSFEMLVSKWNKGLAKRFLAADELNEALFFGGFPEVAIKRSCHFKNRWMSAYQMSYIERDVRNFSSLLNVVAFSKVYKVVGSRTGNLLNIKGLAEDVGLDQRTVARYLEILKYSFQINLLPPWHSNVCKQLVKTPKVYTNDTGMASFLYGIDSPQKLRSNSAYGAILETWLWSEIRKQLPFILGVQNFLFRSHLGREIDFILEKGRTLLFLECKSSDQVREKDLSPIEKIKGKYKGRVLGIIFYSGEKAFLLNDYCAAVPFGLLLV
ncbi:MAG: DUF4143 domain-containing protein, partial [Puniceicoccales bacterium]|nr:DUF4143 domain-containing protein [Puniceicoccales bacterium]